MKKITAALLLTAISAGAASANHTGFNLGLGLVTGSTSAKYSDKSSNETAANGQNSFKADQGKTLFAGRLEAGYGMTFAGSGFVGVSVYGTLGGTKFSSSQNYAGYSPIHKAQLKNTYNYGVELKLGYHLTKDTIGFIGIAAEAAKYKITWQQANTDAAGTLTSGLMTLNASKTKIAPKPVIGLRTLFTKNLYLEAKYGYTFAGKVNLNVPTGTNGYFTNNGGTYSTRAVSFRPRTHEFSVTLGWKF